MALRSYRKWALSRQGRAKFPVQRRDRDGTRSVRARRAVWTLSRASPPCCGSLRWTRRWR